MSGLCQVRRQEQPSMARLYPGACPRPGTKRCRHPGTRRAPVVPSHARHPRASAANPPEAFPQPTDAASPRLKRGHTSDGRRTRTRPARAAEHGSALPGCLPASRNRAVPSPGHPTRTGSAEPCSAPARQRGKPPEAFPLPTDAALPRLKRGHTPDGRRTRTRPARAAEHGSALPGSCRATSSRAWLGSTRSLPRNGQPGMARRYPATYSST